MEYQTVSNLGVARTVERVSSRIGILATNVSRSDGAWLGGIRAWKCCHKSILVYFRAHALFVIECGLKNPGFQYKRCEKMRKKRTRACTTRLAPSPLLLFFSPPLTVRWTSPFLNTARTVPPLSHLVSFISIPQARRSIRWCGCRCRVSSTARLMSSCSDLYALFSTCRLYGGNHESTRSRFSTDAVIA